MEVNEEYNAQFAMALNRVTSHAKFVGIKTHAPKGIDKDAGRLSGYSSAFDPEECADALSAVGKYQCAGNLFWLNPLWTATPGARTS